MWNYKIAMAASIRLSAEMASRFWNVMNEDVRALKDALKNVNQERVFQEGFYQVFCYRPKFHIFFLLILMVRKAPREKHNLWFLGIWSWCACLFSLTLTAEIWLYLTPRLRCMKKEFREGLIRKESAIKNCHKFFSKKIHFKFQVYKKDRSQLRSRHSVCFRSQQDKTQVIMKLSPNFTSIPFANLLTCWKTNQGHPTRFVLLYQVKL